MRCHAMTCNIFTIMVRYVYYMASQKNIKLDLDKKYLKVIKTPDSFALYEAIHDFIQHIELNSTLYNSLSSKLKINRDQGIPAKYGSLRQIYQGIEDTNTESEVDLGHERYTTICDLNRIQDGETLMPNAFWKKRETFKKFTGQIYERLSVQLADVKK